MLLIGKYELCTMEFPFEVRCEHGIYTIYIYRIYIYVIVVTWARRICLICMPEARGLRAYISGKSRVHMLQVICNTSGTLKICPNLTSIFTPLYIVTGTRWDSISLLS